jgi:hypothetical protein
VHVPLLESVAHLLVSSWQGCRKQRNIHPTGNHKLVRTS